MIRGVLFVDDDAEVRGAIGQTLELADLEPILAGSFIEAKDHIAADFEGVVVSDVRMPGRDGMYLLDYTRDVDPDLPVIMLTGEGDIPLAVGAMERGAFGFLEKPCPSGDLVSVIRRALKTRSLVLENRLLKARLDAGDVAARMIFGHSALAEALRAQVRKVAPSGADVLVTGPAGSGISKVAEVIHLMSDRSASGFVKRAAAGVDAAQIGALMDEAAGGTLFLDEIGAMPEAAQFALAGALDAGASVRLLGGCTGDLAEKVSGGGFNGDLYYRLEGVEVRIPSLAERPEDIPVLYRHYVAQAAEQSGIAVPEISQEHLAGLMSQEWPGNARSLMSAAMRFVLGMPSVAQTDGDLSLSQQMARVERSLLVAALGRHNGKAAVAAAALKVPRKTFYDKLARYGIRPEDYRR